LRYAGPVDLVLSLQLRVHVILVQDHCSARYTKQNHRKLISGIINTIRITDVEDSRTCVVRIPRDPLVVLLALATTVVPIADGRDEDGEGEGGNENGNKRLHHCTAVGSLVGPTRTRFNTNSQPHDYHRLTIPESNIQGSLRNL
jgi:hypothetical protein